MGLEGVICIVGFVIILYFVCKPRPEKKEKDKLTNEVKPRGLPPEAPWNSWIPPQ